MKNVIATILSVIFLFGCSNETTGISDVMDLRAHMTKGNGYGFLAAVTADYGDRVYEFTMDCVAHPEGTVDFTVMGPETIEGVKGTVSQSGGRLVFEDQVLLFESLTAGQVTPVIGPYLMIKAIQGGYIRCATIGNESNEVTIDDTFGSESFYMILTLGKDRIPTLCELFWENRRILSISITKFESL